IAFEDGIRIIKKNRQWINISFHQVLKEMSSKRWFGRTTYFLPGKFDQCTRIVNITVRDMHPKIRRGCTPATGSNCYEGFAFERRIELTNGTFQLCTFLLRLKPEISFWRDIENITDSFHRAMRNHGLRGKDDVVVIQVIGDLNVCCALNMTLRTAL